ncbi:MAG: ribonuclease Z [Paludibacteraceae bacterium]|jgi:ribonuclease Z|nr:ribonuclease Z [Paludibacteraceae bacterium]NLK92805.1 ribonuclease Z [Bacteroidales bacterium]MBP6435904.1 ribonuclease Z [Paludibacteraceae bacterium]MBP8627304.1 ribonuclease Z [Paludibacteraceae bacterium]MBP8781184.1 ribonuclease Z [Paludibacteraceae bacterium]
MKAELTILGCGSAMPSYGRFSASQVLSVRDKSFMIDCADGTLFRMREIAIKTNRLNHIFISHLHGDHCFGLMAVLSTLGLMKRTADIYIHAHPDLENLLQPHLRYFCNDLTYKIFFVPYNPLQSEIIYEDKSLTVTTIPLRHGIPTCGFLFKEKPQQLHIKRDMIDFYQVGIKDLNAIKDGKDYITNQGETIPNSFFTTPASPQKSYAYCCDTAYSEKIIPIIEGVDCLYHDATFAENEVLRAKKTLHSTAKQAATIASKAQVKQLLLGHFSARYPHVSVILNEAQTIFANSIIAEDKKTYTF